MAAYFWWGGMVLYFKAVAHIAAVEVAIHRVFWSALMLLIFLALAGRLRRTFDLLRSPRVRWTLVGSAILIGSNWVLYVWAVANNLILQTSLGYYINPLINVLLGCVILKERLSRAQMFSVALAGAGVLIMGWALGRIPWVSLVLGGSFAVYGLLRKRVAVDGTVGLAAETTLLTPLVVIVAGYMAFTGQLAFGHQGRATDLLLMAAGPASALPLIVFVEASKRLKYSTLGLMMYVLPTIYFLLAVFLYDEPFGSSKLISFGFIWVALTIYTIDSLRQNGRERADQRARELSRLSLECLESCPETSTLIPKTE
ncbi:MAG: EamA family transporter RarD [candidate division Zixibacteria bacterium]|nr:EamA family transporter RarD [candidate division Zixibacteria bacterium]